jgi:hypothetical protein
MKSSQIFVFIFIGFLVALIHGDGEATTEGVTDVVSTAAATQAGEATTAGSSNTNIPTDESGTTDGSVTQASSGTNPPQSTVPGSTGVPPTTAASCPSQDIIAVKDSATPAFQLNIPPGLECTYYARSTSFTESILIKGPVVAQGPGGKMQIFGDDGNSLYDSTNSPTMGDISTKSSQIKISVTTTTDSFEITINMILEADTCQTPNYCENGGTCQVIQGQESCKCMPCFIGAKCETGVYPCVTYNLVCQAKVPPQTCSAGADCTSTPTCI